MSVRKELPFRQVNETAFAQYPDILFRWFPNGQKVDGGKEFAVGDLSGNASHKKKGGGSVKVNLKTGEWAEMNGRDPKGGDPISLYAWAFCGGKMGEACKLLGAELGIYDGPLPGDAKVVPFPVKNPPRAPEKKPEWKSMVPPPDGVGRPRFKPGYTAIHEYRMPGHPDPVRYVARYEPAGEKKEFKPWTYGTLDGTPGWQPRHPNNPMCLYGLDNLAANPDAPVLVQEGEKKTDDVQAALGAGWACIAWSRGSNAVAEHDWTPPQGREIYVSGDVGGEAAALQAAEILHGIGGPVWIVDLTGFPDKWDLGNAATGEMWKDGALAWKSETGPWSGAEIEAFLKERRKRFDPAPGDVGLEQPGEDDSEWKEDGEAAPAWWIKPLGQLGETCYYLCRRSWRVTTATPDQHTKMKLIGMAPLEYWYQSTHGGGGKIQWDEEADRLIRACENVGRYRVDTVRGRGAWLDNGRTILHLGNMLLVDGVPHGLDLPNSRHVYEKREGIHEAVAAPLKASEAIELYNLINGLKWEDGDISAKLMAGFVVCALVCGALDWRPSIWVTGGSGAGKTTLEMEIVRPVLGGLVCPLASHSTEAGVRQGLDGDALPVVFDEAEAESTHDRHRMQGVLDLVRQSSREGSAPIVKGTQSQTGAKSYTLRSCFMFSSINISMNKLADESRITVLGLKTTPRSDTVAMADYAALRLRITETLTPEFRAGLLARIVGLMPVIKANALTFARAAAEELGSNRAGDQVGTLLAGYYALTSSRELSLDEARAIVAKETLDSANSADAERDEQRLVNFLFQQIITVKVGGSPYDRTIGRLVKAAAGGDENVNEKVAAEVLLDYGIKFDAQAGGVWIANKHAALAEILKETPWSANWNRALKRLDGALPSEKPVYFGAGYPGSPPRAVFVPVNLQNEVL